MLLHILLRDIVMSYMVISKAWNYTLDGKLLQIIQGDKYGDDMNASNFCVEVANNNNTLEISSENTMPYLVNQYTGDGIILAPVVPVCPANTHHVEVLDPGGNTVSITLGQCGTVYESMTGEQHKPSTYSCTYCNNPVKATVYYSGYGDFGTCYWPAGFAGNGNCSAGEFGILNNEHGAAFVPHFRDSTDTVKGDKFYDYCRGLGSDYFDCIDACDTCMCRNCPAGKYGEAEGLTTCKVCGVGEYQDQAGQSSCKGVSGGCTAGQYGPKGEGVKQVFTNAQLCKDCPAGKFQANARRMVCDNCVGGTFSSADKSTGCVGTACPKGKHSTLSPIGELTAAHTCVDCLGNNTPATTGTYQDEEGKDNCKTCPAGKHQSLNAQEGCVGAGCAPGKYSSAVGGGTITCSECPSGKYAPTSALNHCCTTFSSGACATEVVCPAGKFGTIGATLESQTTCTKCPGGQFQDEAGKDTCKGTNCSVANEWAEAGANASTPCSACPFGKHNTVGITYDPSSCAGAGCPLGKFSTPLNHTSCTNCTSGTYTDQTGQKECKGSICPTGRFAPEAQTSPVTCTKCPSGKYQDGKGESSCKGAGCQPGQRGDTGKGDNTANCIACLEGKYSSAAMISSGRTDCEACPAGKYQPNPNKGECIACESGKYEPASGQSSCGQGVECVPGYFGPLGSTAVITNRCTACPSGKHQQLNGQGGCNGGGCPAGKYGASGSQNAAFATCLSCPPGKYSDIGGAGACTGTSCQAGTFGTIEATTVPLSACNACPVGKYQSAQEADECGQCEGGKSTSTTNSISVSQCLACSAGRYSGIGTECFGCDAGMYGTTTGQSGCKNCPQGKYQSTGAQTACLHCPSGKHSNSTLANVACLGNSCAAGKFHEFGQTQAHECKNCTAGQYQGNTGQQVCFGNPCPIGTFGHVGQATLKACTGCPGGQFTESTGQTGCKGTDCAAGRYDHPDPNTPHVDPCHDCPSGKYQSATSASNCTGAAPCVPGKYGNVGATNVLQTTCKVCPAGKHTTLSGQGACLGSSCAAGRFNALPSGTVLRSTSDLATCLQCPNGKSQANTGEEVCIECAKGKAQPSLGQLECNACQPGKTSDLGATGCIGTLCQPGKSGTFGAIVTDINDATKIARLCTDCPAGQHQNAEGQGPVLVEGLVPNPKPGSCTVNSAGAMTCPCIPCPPGAFTALSGQLYCQATQCSAGKFSPGGSGSQNSSAATCFECPQGKFQDEPGKAQCKSCGKGKYRTDSQSHNHEYYACVACPTSQFQNETAQMSCKNCPVDKYRNTASPDNAESIACTQCPSGKYQNQEGQTECKGVQNCALGLYWSGTECKKCPAGKFINASLAGTDMCFGNSCPPGKFGQSGATALTPCTDCAVGRYQHLAARDECIECDSGKYRTLDDASSPETVACASCGSGRFQPLTGQMTCTACGVGKSRSSSAADQPENIACSTCDSGKYQDQESQLSCKPWAPCPAGKFTHSVGTASVNTNCTVCPTGTYQANSGVDACVSCAAGKYRNTNAASSPEDTACTTCSDSSYQPEIGNTSCIECAGGKYRNLAYASSSPENLACALECGPGTRTVISGSQRTCVQCDQGQFQASSGMSSCTQCTTGKYSEELGASSCKRCALGTYADQGGQPTCKKCPIGQMAKIRTGSVSSTEACDLCKQGTIRHVDQMSLMWCCPCTVDNLNLQIKALGMDECRFEQYYPYPFAFDNTERTSCPYPPTPPPTPPPAPGVSSGETVAYAGIGIAALGAALRAVQVYGG